MKILIFIHHQIVKVILAFVDFCFKISGRKLSDQYWSSYHLRHFILKDYRPEHLINRIAFLISDNITFKHLENIIRNMPDDTFDIIIARHTLGFSLTNVIRDFLRKLVFQTNTPGNALKKNTTLLDENIKKLKKSFNTFTINEIFNRKMQYSYCCCMFPENSGIYQYSNGIRTYGIQLLGKKLVRTVFLMGAYRYSFNPKTNAMFNMIFCNGKWQKERYDSLGIKAEVIASGSPRFDEKSNGVNKEEFFKNYNLDKNKKTILWIPTHGRSSSSVLRFLPIIQKLEDNFNIILSVPLTSCEGCYGDFPFLNFRIKKYTPGIIIINTSESSQLLGIADYVFCDYGGSVFTAICRDKNVLLLNADNDRRVSKLLGEDSPEIEIRKEIVNFYKYEKEKLINTLNDKKIWEEQKAVRQRIRERFFTTHSEPSGKIIADILVKKLQEASP